MPRQLPPLKPLRAFEAAGRHLSFTKAAQELNVTQAAISHQVKTLEDALQIQLFRRFNRRLMLTDAGQTYLPALTEALDQIDAATRRLRTEDDSGNLKISVATSLAAKWLLPRLAHFRQRHPDIDVQVSASDTLVDFARDDMDMGIRYGLGDYTGLRADKLMQDTVFPVCSPALLKGPLPLDRPSDLRHHTLLHEDWGEQIKAPDWRAWLAAAGVTGVNPTRGPGYSHSSLSLQSAMDGEGVALGRSSLVSLDLDAGRLVQPFGPVLPTTYACYVVSPAATAERPKIKAFREWLLEQAAADRSSAAGKAPF
jgi:LysR family transcriptional regulator, glycine cleavage system transcriptional activator